MLNFISFASRLCLYYQNLMRAGDNQNCPRIQLGSTEKTYVSTQKECVKFQKTLFLVFYNQINIKCHYLSNAIYVSVTLLSATVKIALRLRFSKTEPNHRFSVNQNFKTYSKINRIKFRFGYRLISVFKIISENNLFWFSVNSDLILQKESDIFG